MVRVRRAWSRGRGMGEEGIRMSPRRVRGPASARRESRAGCEVREREMMRHMITRFWIINRKLSPKVCGVMMRGW